METTKFKTKGFWYNLYRFNYKTELPEDTCTFKRGIIAAFITSVVLLPLALLRVAYRFIMKIPYIKREWNWTPIHGLVGYVPPAALIIVPLLFGALYFGTEEVKQISNWLVWLVGFGIMLLVIGILIGGAFTVARLDEWRDDYQYRKRMKRRERGDNPENKTAFENLYESWKDKLCKKIDWEN